MKRILDNNKNTQDYWEEVYRENKYDLGVDLPKFHFIATQLIDGSVVVDYGCGVGELLKIINMLKPKCKLFGIDHATNDLKTQEMTFIKGDIYTPAISGADYVISTEVLEHLDHPQKHIDCLYNSLKSGGEVILTTPYSNRIPSEEHIWEFDYDDLEMMFANFSKVWVMPFASGRSAFLSDGTVFPSGNEDTILVKAIK
jgi:2-polyprenyl-3-methyl-5-hydroxy-6-metoxy-1,4-benzoquinol methylase